MKQPTSCYTKITGTGSYLPRRSMSNQELVDQLAKHGVDTSDEWIVTRTGIRNRYLAAAEQTSSELGLIAAHHALQAAGREAQEIDLIIVATSTPDCIFPSTACLIQGRLGNANAAAFDVQAVCSGFVYALTVAHNMIVSGQNKRALVIGTEVFSRLLDWNDRSTCVLFGDGAGAVILEAADKPGILACALHADGSKSDILCATGQIAEGKITGHPFLQMEGQAVFKLAVAVLGEVAFEVLDRAQLTPDALDWLIPHQANLRILQATAKKLGIPEDKLIVTVDQHGNTSAASVPLALDIAVRDGRIQSGHTVMIQGVGGGFTWGAVLIEF